jgi:hypothetical protein
MHRRMLANGYRARPVEMDCLGKRCFATLTSRPHVLRHMRAEPSTTNVIDCLRGKDHWLV